MIVQLLWVLDERIFWRFNSSVGASRIAMPAYQAWPTNGFRFEVKVQLSNNHIRHI